jgi:hypothetical protein
MAGTLLRWPGVGPFRAARNDPYGSCGTTRLARTLTLIVIGSSAAMEVKHMRDDLDDRLHDAVALDEIDLYAEVLSAVAAADKPLTDAELDAVLGLGHSSSAAPSVDDLA